MPSSNNPDDQKVGELARELSEAYKRLEKVEKDWEAASSTIREASKALFPDAQHRALGEVLSMNPMANIGDFPSSSELKKLFQEVQKEGKRIAEIRKTLAHYGVEI